MTITCDSQYSSVNSSQSNVKLIDTPNGACNFFNFVI